MNWFKKNFLKLCLLLLTIAILLGALIWRDFVPELLFSAVSPKNKFRIEVFYLAPVHKMFVREYSQPGFARFYNNITNTLIEESQIVDLMGNGDVRWLSESQSATVGVDIRFSGFRE